MVVKCVSHSLLDFLLVEAYSAASPLASQVSAKTEFAQFLSLVSLLTVFCSPLRLSTSHALLLLHRPSLVTLSTRFPANLVHPPLLQTELSDQPSSAHPLH